MVLAGMSAAVFLVYGRSTARSEAPRPYHFPSAELAALDGMVQKRISDTNNPGGGAQRVGAIRRWFRPKDAQERRVLEKMNRAGTQVLFYAIGGPDKPFHPDAMCNPLKGPILITSGRSGLPSAKAVLVQPPADAPTDKEFMDLAERMWNEPAVSKGLSSQSGRWKIEAVPVFANRAECVQCHTPSESDYQSWTAAFKPASKRLKLGDPLGVAFYCYASP